MPRATSIRVGLIVLLSALFAVGQQDRLRLNVDLVLVPVSVRASDGRIVSDLQLSDFTVLEDGQPQAVSEFDVEPRPLSAAVLVDTGATGPALRSIAASGISLSEAFSDQDEVALYRYDHVFFKLSDFGSDDATLEKAMKPIASIAEKQPGQARIKGVPLADRLPKVLRKVLTYGGRDVKVLHDSVFTAMQDLIPRSNERRKILVLISDGQESGQNSHTQESNLGLLLKHGIQVYGITLDGAILEGSLSRLHSYAKATGGDVYRGRNLRNMENAYGRITEQARYQYVLGYVSRNAPPAELPVTRKIEVQVRRADVSVHHRREYVQFPRP